jgi:hypothetical protein
MVSAGPAKKLKEQTKGGGGKNNWNKFINPIMKKYTVRKMSLA